MTFDILQYQKDQLSLIERSEIMNHNLSTSMPRVGHVALLLPLRFVGAVDECLGRVAGDEEVAAGEGDGAVAVPVLRVRQRRQAAERLPVS